MNDRPAGTLRTLAIARPARRRLAHASLLGAGAIGASIALMGTSAWLISRAAAAPGRGFVDARHRRRPVLRALARLPALRRAAGRPRRRAPGAGDLRVRVYESLEAVAPAGLPLFRRGDLVARAVNDVDSLQDVVLRVIEPFAVAALVGVATVAAMWWVLPAGRSRAARRARALGHRRAVADGSPGAARGGPAGDGARRACRRSRRPGRGRTRAGGDGGDSGAARPDRAGRRPPALVVPARGGHGRHRTRPHDGAGRPGQLGRPHPRACAPTHGGSLNGALLAVLALVPLAAVELVSPLPAATQALQRSRVAAGRVFAAMDAPPVVRIRATPVAVGRRRRTRWSCARCGPRTRAPGGRRCAAST